MKCETCGNAMVWVGPMCGGCMTCEHCANDDNILPPELAEALNYKSRVAEALADRAKDQAASNPLRCPNACCMNGGSGYCSCYGEPSILKDPLIDNKLNPYAKCSHCGNSISNCSCRIQELTYRYLLELKGEFKC